METIRRNAFLAGILGSPRATYLSGDNQYRKYRTTVRTSATIGGVEDSRSTAITYEIGRAVSSKGRALAAAADGARLIEAGYPTNSVIVEDFVGLAKKYTNFSANFAYSSLAGVVERLARSLAAVTLFDDVVSTDIRGNRPLVVNALGTYDGPVSSLTDTVFIPRLVNTSMTGDAFAVLVNAVAGEGSIVATDVIELDANTRQPIIPEVDSAGLGFAIVDALRILGANMVASDQGPLFALALTRGLHRVLTVVGHTDEGGITRDMLRCSGFSPPFGGIHHGLETYSGIPALNSNGVGVIAGYTDGICLATAALVAHCDPGDMYNGAWYPQLFDGTDAGDNFARPGSNIGGTAQMSARIRSQLLAVQGRFWDQYIRGLGEIFCAPGSVDIAVRFSTAATYALPNDPRHLRYASVTPWYWVEPTSLLPANFLGTRAEQNGSGSIAGRSTTVSRAGFEGLSQAGEKDTTYSAYYATLLSARRCWFLYHWLNHPLNGLGSLKLRQLDPNGIIQPGGHATLPEIRDRLEADLPITDYLWVRGQSPFPAPGELMNLGKTVGFLVRHITWGDDGVPIVEHLPTSREFLQTYITLDVGRPIGLVNSTQNTWDSTTRRNKTRATKELSASKSRALAFGISNVGEMPTLSSAPMIGSFTAELPPNRQGGGTFNDGRSAHAGTGGAAASERQPDGDARPAVPHYDPLRAPQLPRQGAAGGGGGMIPPRGGPGGSGPPTRPPSPVGPAGGTGPGGPPPPPGGGVAGVVGTAHDGPTFPPANDRVDPPAPYDPAAQGDRAGEQ